MKTLLLLCFVSQIAIAQNLAPITHKKSQHEALQKEIVGLMKHYVAVRPFDFEDQEVQISFLINASQEIVLQDISAKDDEACSYVREALSFTKIRYPHARQLQLYTMSIVLTCRKASA